VTADLMQKMRETLDAAAKHFRLDLDVDSRMTDTVLQRHSKTGEPFNVDRRAERIAKGLRIHSAEIDPVVKWARKVADRTGIALDVPHPLLM
jgi:hypothetical protein